MDELHEQTVNLLSFQQLPKKIFDTQVAFNMLTCFVKDSATPQIYTLSLHDALPILGYPRFPAAGKRGYPTKSSVPRSEERFSRNAETELVCRLLLEKKKLAQLQTTGEEILFIQSCRAERFAHLNFTVCA